MCRFSTVRAPPCVTPALDGQGQVTPGKAETPRVRGERRSAKRGESQGFEYGCALWRYRQGSSGFFGAGGWGRVGFRGEAEQALVVFQGGLGGVRREHSFQSIVGFFQQLVGVTVALGS